MDKYYIIDPQTYDDQFWWKKDDIEFWKLTCDSPNKTILELAAGTGRLGVPLIRERFQYIGLELSDEYVEHANLKFNSSQPIISGDMRAFNHKQKYDVIFIGFNSFLHLLTEADSVKCLKSIKKHIHNKTKVYIDIFMPNLSLLCRSPRTTFTVMEFFDSQNNCLSTIEETISYDISNKIVSIQWKYKNKKNIYYKEFDFQMKIYYPNAMKRLLMDNGFNIYNLWGSYDKAPLRDDSPLQIYEFGL